MLGIWRKMMVSFRLVVFALLAVFLVAVLGCGSGMMPSMFATHGEGMECSNMFIDEFVVSQKDLGSGLMLVLLTSSLFLVAAWATILVNKLLALQCPFHRLLKARNLLLRLHDPILQSFSQGILHPQIY